MTRKRTMNNPLVTTLVFDLVGVLFYINKLRVLRFIGRRDVIFYFLKTGKNPLDEGIMLLDRMRKEVPGQFQDKVTYKGTPLPRCLLEWNQDLISRDEAFEQIKHYFAELEKQHYFTSARHKRVILNLLGKIFSPELGLRAFRPVDSTITLVKKLKATKNYKLYILSNIDKETFEDIRRSYAAIFDLFDGIVTSCYSNLLKPEFTIFEYLFNQYNLDPAQCCFIDDQWENIDAAQQLGMQVVYCPEVSDLSRLFKEKGLL